MDHSLDEIVAAAPIENNFLVVGQVSTTAVTNPPFVEVRNGEYNGDHVHVYVLPREQCGEVQRRTLWRIARLAQANHANVVQVIGIGMDASSVFVLTESTDFGTVRHHLEQKLWFDTGASIKILHDVASGMRYLHGHEILHRALTTDTIHLSSGNVAKISNLEFARQRAAAAAMTNIGIPFYAAPEILTGATNYTTKVDVYSFAMLIVEVVTKKEPYANVDAPEATILEHVVQKHYRPVFDRSAKWPADLFDLMKECWSADPEKRPTFDTIVPRLEAILDAVPP
ncbi:TKL protein kinase [Saprolegnia parasitica CBS 223.65]|uniref:TKL protein kinase n=1 Tax=Saprolegnia parasitica (strain CBS 223.65) TaxID=695850 RepID=A0A067CG00_SAPPC|nr:TKL protein kinase [Saprolegnia parasitica CBS 223.65]KDO28105.1 TKL protein kinase [Saprolegnia parasitica CBS 223.65]|eukprot:XP_012201246.1 TKL protein kinase [Saprolegnia parasitica CBS 223.65]